MRSQLISKSKPIQNLNPQALLHLVQKKGSFPKFNYNKAEDKMLAQLEVLANRYRQTLSLNDKAELLKHEREMLYEEIQNPELTLARYYPEIKKIKFSKNEKKNIEDFLTLFNLNAIIRIDGLSKPFAAKFTKDKENIIKNAYQKINQASPMKNYIEKFFNQILDYYNYVLKNNKHSSNTQEILAKLNENINQPELLKEFLVKSKPNKEEISNIKKLITKILTSENIEPEVFRYAVWGAGKYRSDESFGIIKEIALNKDEKDIRKREFAIHSTAQYLREKTKDVYHIMEVIKKENSLFSHLAQIIDDKIKGKYYSKKDRELNYYEFTPEEKKEFKKFKNKFFIIEKKPNIKQKNALDRNLIPIYSYLKSIVNDGFKFFILDDTFTKINTTLVGKRDFKQSHLNNGCFEDSYDGICSYSENFCMMNSKRIEDAFQSNNIAHENGHIIHDYLSNKEFKEILKLYNSAVKEGRTLDDYASANEYEYFAQGFNAFASIYIPHKYLLDNSSISNTIFKLIDQDPALYKFIEKLIYE